VTGGHVLLRPLNERKQLWYQCWKI